MPVVQQIRESLLRWIDPVATALLATLERFAPPNRVVLIEDDGGALVPRPNPGATFGEGPPPFRIAAGMPTQQVSESAAAVIRGSHVELLLRSNKILFRPIELPGRASEFLDGIIRAQIDRLTPWAARDAVFGWSEPLDIATDRIALTVAATARSVVAPYVHAIAEHGARSIAIFTPPADSEVAAPGIKILEQSTRGALERNMIRQVLFVIIVGAGLLAAAAAAADMVAGSYLDEQREEVSQRVARLRSALRLGADAVSGAATTQLERRKRDVPSATLVLEALSDTLPDHTYVTEFRIDGDKLQITGISRDAPSLIPLLERSPHFVRASFFAPTTRSGSDGGDQFHIEVTIRPVFPSGT